MTTLGEEIRRLERFVARGDAQRALEGYERLLAQMPRDPVLRSRVGFLRNLLHRHAPDWQVRTYVISPRAVAEAHIMGERFAEALEILEGLLELDPSDTGLARRVAMVRALRDGLADDGLEPTGSTRIMSPEMLVEAHLAAGEVESALRLLERLAERRPDDERLRQRIEALKAAWDATHDEDLTSVTQVQVPSPRVRPDAPPPLPGRGLDAAGRTPEPDPTGLSTTASSAEELPTVDDLPRYGGDGPAPAGAVRPAAAAPGADAEEEESGVHYDTAVLATLLEKARAVIREHTPGETPDAPPPSALEDPGADLPTLATAPPPLPPAQAPAPPPPPLPRRGPAPSAAPPPLPAMPEAPPVGAVRAVRRQGAPARGGQHSVEDLLSGDPHKSLDGKLLGTPEGQIDPRLGADWDIHEMLTETGTKPGIKLPAAPPVSPDRPFEPALARLPAAPPPAPAPASAPAPPKSPPPPAAAEPRIPRGTIEYEELARFARPRDLSLLGADAGPMAAAEDFEDSSTINHAPPDAEQIATAPEQRAPATTPEVAQAPAAARASADLFDDEDEPTLLEESPLRAAQDTLDDDEDATLAHQDPRRAPPPPTTKLRPPRK